MYQNTPCACSVQTGGLHHLAGYRPYHLGQEHRAEGQKHGGKNQRSPD